jgi:hypothetical protein
MFAALQCAADSSVSLFDLKACFFVPTCGSPRTPSAATVKAERRDALAAIGCAASSCLDGGEHGVRLPAVEARCYAPLMLRVTNAHEPRHETMPERTISCLGSHTFFDLGLTDINMCSANSFR